MPDRLEELRLRLRLVQTTRLLPLDVRLEEFHEALADILEMRSGFDPDARRVHLARRISDIRISCSGRLRLDREILYGSIT
jgi:hypothetical protein